MAELSIQICSSPDDAISKGFSKDDMYKDWTGIFLKQAVVVRNGMQSGNSTIDLIFEDLDGNKLVCLVPSKILKAIPE